VREADARTAAPAYLAWNATRCINSATGHRVRRRTCPLEPGLRGRGLALTLAALALFTAANDHYRLDAVSVPLLMLQTLPIAWRRRNPMRILLITGSAITVYGLLGYLGANGTGDSGGAYGVVVAFYTVAAHEPRRRAMVAAAITPGAFC